MTSRPEAPVKHNPRRSRDEPTRSSPGWRPCPQTPRAQGPTDDHPQTRTSGLGRPASAGINHILRWQQPAPHRSPRKRGDQPNLGTRLVRTGEGRPANAGINLAASRSDKLRCQAAPQSRGHTMNPAPMTNHTHPNPATAGTAHRQLQRRTSRTPTPLKAGDDPCAKIRYKEPRTRGKRTPPPNSQTPGPRQHPHPPGMLP